jgi:hypothetical protein
VTWGGIKVEGFPYYANSGTRIFCSGITGLLGEMPASLKVWFDDVAFGISDSILT